MVLSRKIRGVVQLFRPELASAAGICVVIGEIVATGNLPSAHKLLLGFLCGFFISSPALILNDYFDIEVDRINAPNRPLPAGIISPREVIALTIGATVLGLATAFIINMLTLIICIILWIIGFLYNWRFKETGLLGNLMVCVSVAATFILGGIIVGEPWNKIILTFSLIAFLFDFAEEIAADAMDTGGDIKRNSKSLAIRVGKDFALRISGFLFALAGLVSFIPVFFSWLGMDYLLMILITDALIGFFVLKLIKSRTLEEGRFFIRRIHLSASFGMLALVLGQLFF